MKRLRRRALQNGTPHSSNLQQQGHHSIVAWFADVTSPEELCKQHIHDPLCANLMLELHASARLPCTAGWFPSGSNLQQQACHPTINAAQFADSMASN